MKVADIRTPNMLAAFLAAAIFFYIMFLVVPSKSQTIYSDINIRFTCELKRPEEFKHEWENFFRSNSLSFVNVTQAASERNEFRILKTEIYGLSENLYLSVISHPARAGTYLADIKSRPPTRHDEQLELALIRFISRDLGCKIIETTYDNNKSDALSTFEQLHQHKAKIIEKFKSN